MSLPMMKKERKLLSILVITIIFAVLPPAINATNGARLAIIPQNNTFYSNTTLIYSTFTVNVTVYDVIDLYTWQVNVTYDPTLLDVYDVSLPTDHVFAGKAHFAVHNIGTGWVFYGGTLLAPESGVNVAEGRLAQIEFEIISEPPTSSQVSCNLAFSKPGGDAGAETWMQNTPGVYIPFTAESGYYEYIWAPTVEPYMEAKPSRYEATQLETFNITVWVNNIVVSHRLANVSFTLNYNATLLEVTQVTEGQFLSDIGATTFAYTINDGNLTIEVALNPPYTGFPEGNGVLAVITFGGIFQSARENSCNLRLTNISLLDNAANPIPFQPELTRHSFYFISPATSQITINVPQKIVIGSTATISGTITPARPNVEVTINYTLFTGSTYWVVLAKTLTDNNGNYAYVWTPNEIGYFDFRASWPGDDSVLGAETPENPRLTLEVQAKATSTITITIAPSTTVLVGNNVIISGNISPKRAGVTVTLEYKLANETDWTILGTDETDSQSLFSFTWTTPPLGKYEIRARWPGDSSTEEATSETKTVEIVESLPVDFMAYVPYIALAIVIVLVGLVVYFKKIRKV